MRWKNVFWAGLTGSLTVTCGAVVWGVVSSGEQLANSSFQIVSFPFSALSCLLAIWVTGDVASGLAVAYLLVPAQLVVYGVIVGMAFMRRNWRPVIAIFIVHVAAVLIFFAVATGL